MPSRIYCLILFALAAGVAGGAHAMSGCEKSLLGTKHESYGGSMIEKATLYYPYFKSITAFDPHIVHTADTAVLGQNLYSRLFTMDDDGQVTGDLADDIQWDGRSFLLHIRKGTKTIDGLEIGANDVEISLRRILRKNGNTHGSLQPFLDEASIRAEGESLRLTPRRPELRAFLVVTLASIDFSIVPASVIDQSDASWPIVDFRNTTGLYYVEQDADDGRLVLAINPNHHFYTGKQPKKLFLRPGHGADAVEAFKKGEVDLIPTITMASTSALGSLGEQAHVFRSQPIYLTGVRTSARGLRQLSVKQRLKAGQIIRDVLAKAAEGENQPTSEFFPAFSEGALNEMQKSKLQQVLSDAAATPLNRPVTFGVYPSKLEYFKDLFKDIQQVQVIPTLGKPPWLEPEERQPDFFIIVTDSGFYESLSLLYYNIDQGAFMDREPGLRWLDQYISEPEKSRRTELLRELHYEFLSHGRLFPVSVSPYVSVARKPMRPLFSKFYAGTPLWKLTTD